MNFDGATPYLRRMGPADLTQVSSIEQHSFPDPWSISSFRSELATSRTTVPLVLALSAESPAEPEIVLGYLILWCFDNEMHIANVAIHPKWRGKGWGEKLVRAALELGRRWNVTQYLLEVRKSNHPARRLYQKLGFEPLVTRKNYYRSPVEDALLLGLSTPPEKAAFTFPLDDKVLRQPTP